jgi:glycosyltransferase involved in cell wall biosynthesis
MKIGLVVPHIFMHEDILSRVIFSPGRLALDLSKGLSALGAEVTLFSPGPVATTVRNITADLSLFERELAGRGDSYVDLLKKHPLTFITLARQVQSELIARAYAMANRGELDVVHIYTNEEDIALPFVQLCRRPVVFTHHDPFNFLVKYKNVFPKYRHLNWLSMSLAQRCGMPRGTHWVGNIYHGLDPKLWAPVERPRGDYVAYLGRIIEPKGVHLAIAAAQRAGVKLNIAGKHYAGAGKDAYWQERIEPELVGQGVEYVGFLKGVAERRSFLANAAALVVPSTFEEPFGMVMIEALACGTPVVGLDSGAIGEVVRDGETGFVVRKASDEAETAVGLAAALGRVAAIDRRTCRADFEARFTLERMAQEHFVVYEQLVAHGVS